MPAEFLRDLATMDWLKPDHKATLRQAADTIERLQERIEAIEESPGGAAALRQITRIMKERDAALAEVETLKVRLELLADAELKERQFLQSEVERLKGEVTWWKREAATGQENINFITRQERDRA